MNPGANPIFRTLAILLLLSGCASVPQHLTEESKSAIKNVAIVSLVPESVNFDKIGIISFSSEQTEFDMGSKVTDSILYVSQQRIAKSHPDWVVKQVAYDRADLLARMNNPSGLRATRAKQAFADLARDNDLDAIFVVQAPAGKEGDMQSGLEAGYLREGLSILLKNNDLHGTTRLVFSANLNIAIIGKNGEALAATALPAGMAKGKALEPDDYDVNDNMKHNHRPGILDKLGRELVFDLARRLNLGFDKLGFVGGPGPEDQHIFVVPPAAVIEPAETAPVTSADKFEQCFARCRQYTERSKEQCFDACNK